MFNKLQFHAISLYYCYCYSCLHVVILFFYITVTVVISVLPIYLPRFNTRQTKPAKDDESTTTQSPTTTTLPTTTTSSPHRNLTIRLPTSLVPEHYDVRLQPFIGGNFSIDGSVGIRFHAEEDTDRIVLHMADILTHNETIKVSWSGKKLAKAIYRRRVWEWDIACNEANRVSEFTGDLYGILPIMKLTV